MRRAIDANRHAATFRRHTILNIYEDQNDYQLKQKNGLDFSNFAPTSIINSNSYTLCYAAEAEAKDETFSSSQFFLPCETLESALLPKKQAKVE